MSLKTEGVERASLTDAEADALTAIAHIAVTTVPELQVRRGEANALLNYMSRLERERSELRTALTASEKRRRETDMLAYKWMVAHDRLAAGLQYEFPSPANIPDALARVNELETFVRSVQVPTKDGTWKEVMFRLADEARVILAKGERS